MAAFQEGLAMHTRYDTQFSLFRGSTDAHPVQTVTIGGILEAVRSGAYRQSVEWLRHMRLSQGQAVYNAAKQRLYAVTFGGTFAPTRSKSTLVQHSGGVHGDLDHLNDLQAVKQRLCAEAYTLYCFLSPSGDGLRLGVVVEPVADDLTYKHAWQAIAAYFHAQYGVTWDPSGKDVCRLCFVSWDPEAYITATPQPFLIPPVQVTIPSFHTPPPPQRMVPSD